MPRRVIWQIIPHLAMGGATRVALWLCRGLDPERFQVTLLAGSREAAEGSLEAEVRAQGIDLQLLPDMHRDLRPLQDWACRRRLARRLRAERPDLIHAHGSKALVLAGLAAKQAGVPVVATAHGWPFHEHQSGLMHRLQVLSLRHALAGAAALVAVSQSTREQGLAAGIGRPECYRVIYPGAELTACYDAPRHRAAVREELGLPPHAPVVGTVMRLAPQKAPLDFIRMAAAVVEQVPEAHFAVIGSGPLEAETRAAVSQAGLTDRFRLLGARDDVPRLLGGCDVFALTSLWEGLPIVYAEACAAGLPIVGTRVDGAAEIVEEGRTGFLAPPGHPQAVAQAVSTLLRDPARAQAMGAAARAKVQGMGFEVSAVVRRHETLYDELLGAGGG